MVDMKPPVIRRCAKASAAGVSAASAAAALIFTLLVAARNTSAFLMPSSSTIPISARTSRRHRNTQQEKNMVASITEDDPWVLLEEFKVWAILNRGKYDLIEFQNAINNLRNECQVNIHTIEKEISTIEQSLDEQREYFESHSTSTSSDWSSQQNANEEIVPIPTLKAVFAGYQVTDDDRKRLLSAHPEDAFD